MWHGADYVGFVGSDDWLHEDLFGALDGESVITGRQITLVNTETGMCRELSSRARHGVIPWLIPRHLVPDNAVDRNLSRGLDRSLYHQLRRAPWVFHDPHAHTRVDFKSGVNMTPYSAHSADNGPEAPAWGALRDFYPAHLVELAEHREYAAA